MDQSLLARRRGEGKLRGSRAAVHTDFTRYARIQPTEDNITLAELTRFALLDNQVCHRTHRGGLLPFDGLAVLLARRLGRGTHSSEPEERVVLQQENETLANGPSGAEDAWIVTCMSANEVSVGYHRGTRLTDRTSCPKTGWPC